MWRLGARGALVTLGAAYLAARLVRNRDGRCGAPRRWPQPDDGTGVLPSELTRTLALRDVVHELGISPDIRAAIDVVVQHAVSSTQAFGAYVERVEAPGSAGDVEVFAVAGRGHPLLGTRIPYPGSLTEEIIASGEPQLMTEIGAIGEAIAPYLQASCRNCSGLVVPLTSKEGVLGALVILRGPGEAHFTPDEARYLRTLGDLATAAFQRLLVIDELSESEERFRQITEHLDQVVWLGEPDLSVRYYVNPAYERIWGRSTRSLYEHPRSPLEAVHPEDRDRVEREIAKLQRGAEYDLEYRIVRPDGEVRWVRSRAYPIRNIRGEVYRVAGIMEDITKQKEIEAERQRLLEEAREARDEVATIVDSITDAFFTLDREWRFTYLNPQAEALLRRSREELLGKNYWEVFSELEGSPFEREFRRAMEEQRTAAFDAYYAPFEQWLDVRAYPSRKALSVYYRDVTERKRVESELRSRVRQLDALATLGQRALVERDLDRLFELAVESVAEGVDADLTGLLELLPGESDLVLRAGTGWREGLVGKARTSADQGSMAGYTLLSAEPVIAEDLRTETRFRPSWFLHEHGGVSGLSVVILGRERPWGALGAHTTERRVFSGEDISFLQSVANILSQSIEFRRVEAERLRLLEGEREARRESEKARAETERRSDELERVIESRARLMRGFSHDVKNPLGAADGFLQLLEEGVLDELSPRQRQGVERARHAIGDALHLIDDLLTIARAESGKVTLELGPTDLLATISAAAEDFQARAAMKGLALITRLPDRLPSIRSDSHRIRQILGNLLSNAVKYTEEGSITVTASVLHGTEHRRGDHGEELAEGAVPTPDQWVAVDVSDTGPGIPEDQQRLIFREFGRAEAEDQGESQGIGLYIGQRIARALGGEVTVRSEVGRGSTFTLWLPVWEEEQ